MDKELIERLAKEAGIDIHADTLCRYEGWGEPLQRFAALVAEECARTATRQVAPSPHAAFFYEGTYAAAKAIREDFSHGASKMGLRDEGSANRAPNVLTAR